ncbi:hypothetical protein CCACVL1_19919 [Corchorus capsularis]|uniref:Uncharacterized protein n=1 Tax=Corchorus capsularis TaxID=210143 RepID=A0A1R3HDX2_COCAP|nr:hypothetical protein CCACVL1_19919 [Corchorus capsularis]
MVDIMNDFDMNPDVPHPMLQDDHNIVPSIASPEMIRKGYEVRQKMQVFRAAKQIKVNFEVPKRLRDLNRIVSKVDSDKVLLDKKLNCGEIMPDEYMRRSEALLNKWKQAWSKMAQGLANFDGCVGEEEDYDWNLNRHEEFVQGLDRKLCALIRINSVCVVNTSEDLQLLVSVGMDCNIIVERDNEKLINAASSFPSVIRKVLFLS